MSSRDAFIDALRQEIRAIADFNDLLDAENDCLKRGDVDALLALANAKSDQTALLSRLFEQRRSYLKQEGFTPDRIGMSEWLVVHAGPEIQPVSELWQELLEHAAAARQRNEANGALIAVRMRHNSAALAALQSATAQMAAYGPDGTTQLPTSGRTFGSA